MLGALIGGIKRAEQLGIVPLSKRRRRLWNLHMHILQSKQYDCLLDESLVLWTKVEVLERIGSDVY